MKIFTALISYFVYNDFDWIRVCIETYQRHFPCHTLLIINHTKSSQLTKYLSYHKNIILLNNMQAFDRKYGGGASRGGHNTHGIGLDYAVSWGKKNDYDCVVFIEPDCFFYGTDWYNKLVQEIEAGKSLASVSKWDDNWSGGSYQPCGSIWRIKDIPTSFDETRKFCDKQPGVTFWDTAGYNYCLLANEKKGSIVGTEGFLHFNYSSAKSVKERCDKVPWIKAILLPILENSYKNFPVQEYKLFI